MKIRFVIIPFFALLLTGCIKIEDIPIITASPSVSIITHISNGKIYATFTLTPNVNFIVAGNVGLSYKYEGNAMIIDKKTGTPKASEQILGEGATQIITIFADTTDVDGIIMIAAGKLDVYGEDSDNTFLTTAPFYGEEQIIFYEEVIPDVVVNPSVTIATHIAAEKLHATVTVNANPEIRTLGNLPIVYKYEAIVILQDMYSGKELARDGFDNGGTTQFLTVSADTTGIDRILVKITGQVSVYAERKDNDGKTEELYINSSLLYAEQEVIINPD